MQVRIQSYPPLGEITTCSPGRLHLAVILEVPKGHAQYQWEVELWGSTDSSVWAGQKLEPWDDGCEPTAFRQTSSSVATLCYRTFVQLSASLQFTLKFRQRSSDVWTWAKQICGHDDGHVIVPVSHVSTATPALPLPDASSAWRVSKRQSQSPGTSLWALEVDVSPSNDDASSEKDVAIGKPWGSFLRWFALVRHKEPWLGPRHGGTDVYLDEDAVVCAFQSETGRHAVLLAVTADNLVESVLRSTETGGVMLHARGDNDKEATATILCSLGETFDSAFASAIYGAREIASHGTATRSEIQNPSDEVRPEWRQEWFDGLGYCTWNALNLGSDLTDDNLYAALDELTQNDIHISNLIIDDGWQAVTSGRVRGWKTFEASNKAFANGLKAIVSRLRENFPKIDHIAVWHAMHGYWGGISPDGQIARTYKTLEVKCGSPYNQSMHVVAKEDVERFYDDFYKFLSDAGIDSVKTDVQHILDCIIPAKPRRDLITAYLDAWTMASLRHFSFRTISCMSQFPQGIFHSQMHQGRPTLIVRNSDDFFPNEASSHAWHIWANAHNSLFTRYMNILPDWDMFQTKHEYGGFHAAARCISGGPIYITDTPGEHDMAVIRAMTGVTVRGKTVIFRPSVVGRSVSHYVGFEKAELCKVGSYHGPSGTGSPILGVFNIAQRPVAEIVPLSSFTGAVPTLDYIVRSFKTGRVSPRIKCGDASALLSVSLDKTGYDILTATPLALFPGDRFRHIWIGNMGLMKKMTGCAAIVSNEMRKRENKRLVIDTRLKALGVLGVWISTLPEMSIDADFLITIQEEPLPRHTVRVSETSENVLEVDIETAWKEMELSSGWSNEVEVKIHFST